MTDKFPLEEPTADVRMAAKTVRQMFVALIQEGFTESQALVIVGFAISASVQGPSHD